ncbi:hypothetical protein [Methanomethylovorans sp.]|uniref:hypothetical protein n=1 Tax=Methanomethylovorans sp. TaxID=2758717 RepID=UPI00351C720B
MKYAKLLMILPLLLVAYVLYLNIINFDFSNEEDDNSYFIDIGGLNDTQGNVKLTGPMERISERITYSGNGTNVTYRELNSSLIYLQVNNPSINDHSKVKVEIRFKDEFPMGYTFNVGCRNSTVWSYDWKTVYNPLHFKVDSSFFEVGNDTDYTVYSTEPVNSTKIDVSEFFRNPPENSVIAAEGNPNINIFPNTLNSEKDSVLVDCTFRGDHAFYTFVDDGPFELILKKQDLNLYNGEDELKVMVYGQDGTIVANSSVPDDGDTTNSSAKGATQTINISLPEIEKGVYKIALESADDLTIRSIYVTSGNFVVQDTVFSLSPCILYTRHSEGGYLDLITYYQSGLQDVKIGNTTVPIKEKNIKNRVLIQPSQKMYDVTCPAGNLKVISSAFFSFTHESYFEPFRCHVIPLGNDLDHIKSEKVDYIVIKNLDNKRDTGGWIIANATWDLNELYLGENTLNIVLNAEHLANRKEKIPIDWIEISFE